LNKKSKPRELNKTISPPPLKQKKNRAQQETPTAQLQQNPRNIKQKVNRANPTKL
jgi:hypothetical protein